MDASAPRMPDPFVFLSYASPDRTRVKRVFDALDSQGVKVWMDSECLLPGQNWEFEILRALESAALVIAFVSHNSVDRTGFVQKELKIACDKLRERPLSRAYLIPVRLDH